MRKLTSSLISLLAAIVWVTPSFAEPLHIAAWNVEHLNEDNNSGCIPRTDDDYAYIAGRISDLDADVVAIQEVESTLAAHRVFPADQWHVVMSDRPNNRGNDGGAVCWGTQNKHLRHQATGFAIKRGVDYTAQPAYAHLAGDNPNQRWGTDVAVRTGGISIRMLSVHLASGCWGAEQDHDSDRSDICTTLQGQVQRLAEWVEARNAANESFIVLGDFNRRLAIDGDWAAEKLLGADKNTTLVTAEVRNGKTQSEWCDARYPDLIDHIIISNDLRERIDLETVIEHPRIRESPDHCIISAMVE